MILNKLIDVIHIFLSIIYNIYLTKNYLKKFYNTKNIIKRKRSEKEIIILRLNYNRSCRY